jgi:hypothetical protein
MMAGRREILWRARRAALRSARADGCVCHPEVHVLWAEPGASQALVGHEAWCPCVRAAAETDGGIAWRVRVDHEDAA